MYAPRGDVVGVPRDVDKMLAGIAQTRAHRAVIVGPVRIGEDLEAFAVVQFEHFGKQIGGRVRVIIG